MKTLNLYVLAFMAFLMVGCSNKPYVETDYQTGFDFSVLKTFSVTEAKQDIKENILISPFTLSHIQAALDTELAKRYQHPAAERTPDFIVNYHVVVEEKIDLNTYDSLYGYYGRGYHRYGTPFLYSPNTGVRAYNQGTLIVDILDGKTNKPIWRGVSEKRLGRGLSPQQQRSLLSQAVTEVIAQFPPI